MRFTDKQREEARRILEGLPERTRDAVRVALVNEFGCTPREAWALVEELGYELI